MQWKVSCKTDLIQSILKATDRCIWTSSILDKVPEKTSLKCHLVPDKFLENPSRCFIWKMRSYWYAEMRQPEKI